MIPQSNEQLTPEAIGLPAKLTHVINLRDYLPLAARTEKEAPDSRHDIVVMAPGCISRVDHAYLGLITELGELATTIKRHLVYEKPLDLKNFVEEVGDFAWYVAILANIYNKDAFNVQKFKDDTWPSDHTEELINIVADMASSATYPIWLLFGLAVDEETLLQATEDLDNLVHVLDRCAEYIRRKLALAGISQFAEADSRELILKLILEANIIKLMQRFPNQFSNEAAEARADKGGLSAKES